MNIIAVDDEPFALEDLATIIRQASPGCNLRTFLRPREALAYSAAATVDVAFLDAKMYELDGIALARGFKAVNPEINIIFVTGYTQYALEAFQLHASGYILKPASREAVQRELVSLRNAVTDWKKGRIRIQTFGNFEVFVDGRPLFFGRAKSKELLALLVDRKGAGMTTAQACAILWEDKAYSASLQSQFRNVVADMMKTLRGIGAVELVVRRRNYISVNVERFTCDYYEFLRGDLRAVNSYAGEYMLNYSWAEFTTGMLHWRNSVVCPGMEGLGG